jgi:glycerol uptake facilitator-like aquaporin
MTSPVRSARITSAPAHVRTTLQVLTFLFLKRSGAHFNPSVTAAVMVSGQRPHEHFTLAIGFVYILVQVGSDRTLPRRWKN